MAVATIKVGDKQVVIQDNNDNKTIDAGDDLGALATELGVSGGDLLKLMEGVTFQSGGVIPLEELITKINESKVPTDGDEAAEKAKTLDKLITTLESKIGKKQAEIDAEKKKTGGGNKTTLTKLEKEKADLESAKTQAETELKAYLEAAGNKSFTGAPKQTLNDLTKKYQQSSSGSGDSNSSSIDSNGIAKQIGANGGNGGGSAPSKAQGSGEPGYGPGWKAGGLGGAPNSTNYLALMGLDGQQGEMWDMIHQAKKQQQMMLLFFYYARMAMSGDIGAMYQFMRFITHIIAQDKALQNVWMGTKLLQLQDVSRKATQKLLDTDVKNEDQESQYNFQKVMQEVKAEENLVATSQKLIAQMMEEFTQIVETLTNVQKSLLDVNGKVLSNLSSWR